MKRFVLKRFLPPPIKTDSVELTSLQWPMACNNYYTQYVEEISDFEMLYLFNAKRRDVLVYTSEWMYNPIHPNLYYLDMSNFALLNPTQCIMAILSL